MTVRETAKQLRERQLDAIRAALAEHPGLSVYGLSLILPYPERDEQQDLIPGRIVHVPLTLVIKRLKELGGDVREEPDPAGAHWYLTGQQTGDRS